MGELEGGILSSRPSPDGELIVFLTRSCVLLTMSLDWQIVNEVPCDVDIDPEGDVNISWRGDGQFFALSVLEMSKTRCFLFHFLFLELKRKNRNVFNGCMFTTTTKREEGNRSPKILILSVLFY